MPEIIFSALHISDLHFQDEKQTNKLANRQENILEYIKRNRLKADCIVISGDIFNRGKLSENDFHDFQSFLQALPGHDYIVVVPGNHDLDRSVQIRKENSFNEYTTRKGLVFEYGKVVSEGREIVIPSGSDAQQLLYEEAFKGFRSLSKKLGFASYGSVKMEDCPAANYEVQVRYWTSPSGKKVRFVLLNTALLAGQAVHGDDYRERQHKLMESYHSAFDKGKFVEAAEIKVKMAKLQKQDEDYGELIIDEEAQENGEFYLRLSLSKAGIDELKKILSTDIEQLPTIFVGHHGFQYLSGATTIALKKAMKEVRSGLYLCGHAHQERYCTFPIQQNGFPKNVEQIQAGILFNDQAGFGEYGFNHLKLIEDDNGEIKCDITLFFQREAPSGDWRWYQERLIDPPKFYFISTSSASADNSNFNNDNHTPDDYNNGKKPSKLPRNSGSHNNGKIYDNSPADMEGIGWQDN